MVRATGGREYVHNLVSKGERMSVSGWALGNLPHLKRKSWV